MSSPITSPQNETFRKILSLTTAKGLKKEGLFLLSGEKLIREYLATPTLPLIQEVRRAGQDSLIPTTINTEHAPLILSAELFDQIDVLGTHAPILVLQQPELPRLTDKDITSYSPKGLEVVAPLGDPANLGAVVRSCEAFAVHRILLTEEAAHPFLPKSVKASAGSVLRIQLCRAPSLASFAGHTAAIALDMGGTPLPQFKWPENALLIVGEEGQGLHHHNFATRLSIPMTGTESLNAVVATSIALAWRYGRPLT